MKRVKILLRTLTLLSYFLPFSYFFVSCESLFSMEIAFSKEEKTRIIESHSSETADSAAADSTMAIDSNVVYTDGVYKDTTLLVEKGNLLELFIQKTKNIFGEIISAAVFPTEESISAIGILYWIRYPVILLPIALSIFATLLLFFSNLFPFIKKSIVYIYWINISSLLLFIGYTSLSNAMDWEWGVLITLGLLFIQLWIEIKLSPLPTSARK